MDSLEAARQAFPHETWIIKFAEALAGLRAEPNLANCVATARRVQGSMGELPAVEAARIYASLDDRPR